MQTKNTFDIIGIGIGPFNLGLAAMCDTIPNFNTLFIEQNSCFNWHPGLMIPGTRLQVPFYADLVTLADPQSKYSYLSFLHATKGLFRFAIRETYFMKRSEYNEYCRWVANQLKNLQFNCRCEAIYYHEQRKCYEVITNQQSYYAKHIVIGIGTVPYLPSFVNQSRHPLLLHSAEYLFRKEKLLHQNKITIIGSGQSAAEIFYDLLQHYGGELSWFTRSDGFFPMDYSKFALEKTSPEYIDHFYSLVDTVKPAVLSKQNHLYKGIDMELIRAIYDLLDDKKSDNIHLHPNCELLSIANEFELGFSHNELHRPFQHNCDAVILATGYHCVIPPFIKPISDNIQWNDKKQFRINRNYSVDKNNSVFIQNAELLTHGFNAADLGMGPYRNAIILNSILGYEHYPMEKNVAFQTFGLPKVCKS